MNRFHTTLAVFGCALFASTPAFAQHEEHGDKHDKAQPAQEKSDFVGDPYLLDTDPVTGEKLARQQSLASLISLEC